MKIDQYRIYKLKTFSLFTDEEKKKHDEIYIEKNGTMKSNKKDKELFATQLAGNEKQRVVIAKDLTIYKEIALFDNDLLRLIREDKGYENKPYSLIKEVLFIEIYHEVILDQILKYGVKCFDKDYIFYTASAGQTRNKVVTLVEKEFYTKHTGKLMNGLTVERINQSGGINIGKYLAYLSLTMSAGLPLDINLDRVIVVPDFFNNKEHEVEFINTDTLKTEIKTMPVKIEHADGGGMFLPGILEKSCQIRGAWIKGALFEFNFHAFADKIAHNNKVIDVWGKTWDIVEDDITIILTASMVKMHGYYKDWQEYKDFFKENKLKLSICAEATEPRPQTEVAYQFLQTLDRNKVDEPMIARLCHLSVDRIIQLHKSLPSILNALGAKSQVEDDSEETQTSIDKGLLPLQEALMLYSPLLQDVHIQKKVEEVVRSYRKKAMAGKLLMHAHYSYISPDWYAICQWLFQGENDPAGLIPNGYVYNAWYNDKDYFNTCDVGRNPHLWNEHCIRKLIKSKSKIKTEQKNLNRHGKKYYVNLRRYNFSDCKKWFNGFDTVVSCRDIISKVLQNDWDGDTCITITTPAWLDCVTPAIPLYYNMFKAEKQEINTDNQYKTLTDAFKANIGLISNAITNEWNINANEPVDLNFIKVLVCYNNFTIDMAKTGSNIELIGEIKDKYNKLKTSKPPKFFKYAKNKKTEQCSIDNTSIVNRISDYINRKTKNIPYTVFKKAQEEFNYGMLLNNSLEPVRRDTKQYDKLQKEIFIWDNKISYLTKKMNREARSDEELKEFKTKFDILYYYCREEMLKIYSDFDSLVNALIDIEYRQPHNATKNKNILWGCFGDVVLQNIKTNLKSDIKLKSSPRFAYSSEDKAKYEKQKPKIALLDTPRSVVITQKDLGTINSLKPSNDQKIFYVIACLCKSSSDNKLVLKASQKEMLTVNKIDNIAGTTTCSAAIDRLKDKGLIKVEYDKKKTTIQLVNLNEDDIAFKVENVWRAMFYLDKYNGKAVGLCEIDGIEFIKKGNTKTCSPRCQKELEKRNKSKNYENSKNTIDMVV